jgi:hypothetical protein
LTTLGAIDRALEKMEKAKQPKRMLIVFSAWVNEYADKESKELSRIKAQIDEGETVVYGFGILGEGTSAAVQPLYLQGPGRGASFFEEILTTFASGSGGLSRIFRLITPVQQTAHASEFIHTVLSEPRGQYVIGYYPKNPDPKAKRVTIVRTTSPAYRVFPAATK